ncbi:hypothetical protein [Actinoplanes sp. NPDC089786]|uniref:hypothetical protein n=1 Tax=Actinoplanes sp. NPDC089786 TaxID=3155185 RepID=UPI00343886E6
MTTDQPSPSEAAIPEQSPPPGVEPPAAATTKPAEAGQKSVGETKTDLEPVPAGSGRRRLGGLARRLIRGAGQAPAGPQGSEGPTAFTGKIKGAGVTPAGPAGSSRIGAPPTGPAVSEVERAAAGLDVEPDKQTDKDSADQAKKADDAGKKVAGEKRRKRQKKALPDERPADAPPDPWSAFAATTERAPGRLRRALRRVGRAFRSEYALVIYAGLLLAVALTWPALQYPLHTTPHELFDPARQAWQIAWTGHALLTDPAQLWQSNAFYPEHNSFAFGDSLLGYAPAGLLGDGPAAALLRYNILFVLAHALLFIGGYALVRQLGAGKTGATVAAVAFAFAPWRLAQEGHLDIVSAGGIPLALAMLARGHGWTIRWGFRPARRHSGWVAAGWLVAAWQVSLGFSLGIPFAYVLVGVVLLIVLGVPLRWWRQRRRKLKRPVLGWRVWIADLLGVMIVACIGALIAIPYIRVPAGGPAGDEIGFFSAPWRSLLIAPAESRVWGGAHEVPRAALGWPAEMTLLPGFALYALALAGLVFSVWRWWQRLILVAGLAVSVILTMGTSFLGGKWTYLPLFGHYPASFGTRIPGRLMLWVTLLLAILAAGAAAEIVRRAEQWASHRIPPFPGPWLRLATFVPLLLVLAETINATPHPVQPDQPSTMRGDSSATLVLPTAAQGDQIAMLWSTTRFQPLANGSGGFAAAGQAELRQSVASFPDQASIDYLRRAGVQTVILVRSRVAGTAWEEAGDVPVDTFGIRREDVDEDTVVFRLN